MYIHKIPDREAPYSWKGEEYTISYASVPAVERIWF